MPDEVVLSIFELKQKITKADLEEINALFATVVSKKALYNEKQFGDILLWINERITELKK